MSLPGCDGSGSGEGQRPLSATFWHRLETEPLSQNLSTAWPLSPSPGRAILTVLTPQNGAAWHNFPDNGRVLRLCVQNGSQELHVVPEHWCGCRVEF